MAEIHCYRCDVCGEVVDEGRCIVSRYQRINGQRKACAYRWDICERCFGKIKSACEAAKSNNESEANNGK